jgi:hypothetical protein
MWSAAALAALFAGWRLWQLMSARVHLGMANAILVKLIKADNLDRAKKLCDAAPRSVYFIAVRAALGSPDDPRPTFEEAFARAMGPLQRWRWMDGTALVAGVVAVVIAATAPHVSAVALLFGIAAAGCALLDVVLMRRLRREPPAVFGSIVEALLARPAGEAPAAAPRPQPPASKGSVLVLTGTVDGEEVGRVALDRDVVKVGKLSSAHLCLDHPSVSRMHAVIETTAEGSTIIDLGSTTGTRVNGEKINKASFRDGDEIQIGDVLVRVTSGAGAPVVTRAEPARARPPAAPAGDLRKGTCPLCGGVAITERAPVAGDLVPWVCEGCGYAQLFAAR